MRYTLLGRSGLRVSEVALGTMTFGEESQETRQPDSPHRHAGEPPTAELVPAREASGTAWQPDESPMYGIGRTVGPWNMMLDATAVGQFLYEPGEIHRTGGFASEQVSSVNWLMAMIRRPWLRLAQQRPRASRPGACCR